MNCDKRLMIAFERISLFNCIFHNSSCVFYLYVAVRAEKHTFSAPFISPRPPPRERSSCGKRSGLFLTYKSDKHIFL